MSRENVEVVRKLFDAFSRDPEAALEFIDAEAVMDWTASRAPYSGIYRGHAEIRRLWQATMEAWDAWTTELREAVEIDRETVIGTTLVRARGKGSGVLIEAHGAGVWSVRDGKSFARSSFKTKPRPSQPWACRSKTLTPTPEPPGYWAGDVGRNIEQRGFGDGGSWRHRP